MPHRTPALVFVLLGFAVACFPQETLAPRQQTSFAELVAELSEPGGYFDTDNLISNESSYGQVLEHLEPGGGAYLGVGPGQNFHYIARLRPRWAFVLDVRRANMLQHLLFRAIISEADSPSEFLRLLFSLPLDAGSDADDLTSNELEEIEGLVSSEVLFEGNLERFLEHIESLGFELSSQDRQTVRANYAEFVGGGLDLRFRSHGRRGNQQHPTFRDLLEAKAPGGEAASFLKRRSDYDFVRDLVRSGRVVPVTGDFAGDYAMAAIGRFIEGQGEVVRGIYTSNVEYYLLRNGTFDRWLGNVSKLPLDPEALFIRACFNYGRRHPQNLPGHRSTLLAQPVSAILERQAASPFYSSWDLCTHGVLEPGQRRP